MYQNFSCIAIPINWNFEKLQFWHIRISDVFEFLTYWNYQSFTYQIANVLEFPMYQNSIVLEFLTYWNFQCMGGSHLSQIFWSMKICRLKHNPAHPIIIISLIMQGIFWEKSGIRRNLA